LVIDKPFEKKKKKEKKKQAKGVDKEVLHKVGY